MQSMFRTGAAFVFSLALIACSPAAQPEAPRSTEPLNLHQVDYELQGTTKLGFDGPRDIVVRHSGSLWQMQIRDNTDFYFILDYPNNRQTLVSNTDGQAIYGPIGFGPFDVVELYNFWFGNPTRFSAENGAVVGYFNGETCTGLGEEGREWRGTSEPDGEVSVCVTNDGIPLRMTDGDRELWVATALTRGPQRPFYFDIPTSYSVSEYTPPPPPPSQ